MVVLDKRVNGVNGVLYITTAIKFLAYKQPCSNIRLVSSKNTRLAPWEKALEYTEGERSKIEKKEMQKFLSDTQNVIMACSFNTEMEYSIGGNSKALELYIQYLNNWGTPFPAGKQPVDLLDIGFACTNIQNYLEFWPLDENNKESILLNTNLINSFWDSIHNGNIATCEANSLFLSPAIDIYEDRGKTITVRPSRFHCSWSHSPPEIRGKHNFAFDIPPFEIQTTRDEIIRLDKAPKEKQITWLKSKIRNSLGRFIKTQMPDLKFLITKDEKMAWSCDIDNRVLYFVLNKLTTESPCHECLCGCGNLVPESRKYFSPQCKDRHKNKDPINKLKAFIRGRKNQGKITEQTKDELYSLVNDLHEENYNPEEIRKEIMKRLGEGE